jgi:hypothetical protein
MNRFDEVVLRVAKLRIDLGDILPLRIELGTA